MKTDVLALVGSGQDEEFQMAPLIDCVFLLLVYFIMTTTLLKVEADLGVQLPGLVKQGATVKMPYEQVREILADGRVLLNAQTDDSVNSRDMPDLTTTLIRFRQACELSNNPAMVTIQADDKTQHQRVIDVLNACASANLKQVTFGMGG